MEHLERKKDLLDDTHLDGSIFDLVPVGIMILSHDGTVIRMNPAGLAAVEAETIDQIADVVTRLKKDPDSRRILVCAWNVADLPGMALPPCHCLFQFYVADGKLSCQLYQRSADVFLGVPFNIASYALLTHMMAQQTDLAVGDFIWTGGDCHLYLNHLEQASEQLSREPLPLPRLAIKRKPDSIFEYRYDDFDILNYESHPHIKAAVAV